jgi:uncharacterized membrane protein
MSLQNFENSELIIIPETEVLLDETRKWAKFLAVLGFIFCGLMILLGVVSAFALDTISPEVSQVLNPVVFLLFYIVMTMVYFFPCLYLYRFAERTKKAINTKKAEFLTGSFDSLRDCFRFLGILSIIILVLYAIGFVIVFVSVLFFSDMVPGTYTLLNQ